MVFWVKENKGKLKVGKGSQEDWVLRQGFDGEPSTGRELRPNRLSQTAQDCRVLGMLGRLGREGKERLIFQLFLRIGC